MRPWSPAGVRPSIFWAGIATAVGAVAYLVWSKLVDLSTGDPNLDRLRLRVLVEATKAGVDPRVIMGIIHNESGGRPENYLGDVTAPGGPSIGPMQVYRRTALDYGLWAPSDPDDRDAYAAMSSDEVQGIAWGVAVFKRKLAEANGDVADAVRRYNGSGSAAEAYRDRALAFISSTYGEDLA